MMQGSFIGELKMLGCPVRLFLIQFGTCIFAAISGSDIDTPEDCEQAELMIGFSEMLKKLMSSLS